MRTIPIVLCACIVLSYSMLFAQELSNPDISVIGNFQSSIHNNKDNASYKKFTIQDPEAEIHIDGQVYHNSKAHVVFGWHDTHSAELEEIYATMQLNNRLGFKIGKFLLDVDNLNILHPHQYSFIRRPLTSQAFFGNDGLRDMATEIQFSFRHDKQINLQLGILKGDFLQQDEHYDEEHEEEHPAELGFFSRIKTAVTISDYSKVHMGASLLNGVHETSEDSLQDFVYRSWLLNGDIKYSYRPSHATSLDFLSQVNFKWSENELSDSYLESYGSFNMFDYHFAHKYNIGALFEYLKLRELHHDELFAITELESSSTKQFALFGGCRYENGANSRLLLGYTKENEQKGYWEMILQLIVEIGPHSGHNH